MVGPLIHKPPKHFFLVHFVDRVYLYFGRFWIFQIANAKPD